MTKPDSVTEMLGLDGSNPLGFLAALGTLRVLTIMYPDAGVSLGWRLSAGTWRPRIAHSRSTLRVETGSEPTARVGRLANPSYTKPEAEKPEAEKPEASGFGSRKGRPRLGESSDDGRLALCEAMAEWLAAPPQWALLESESLGDNLTISPSAFRGLAIEQLERANEGDASAHAALEFLAAFGTDAACHSHAKDRSLMQDTAFRTMSGAGHQHFIKFMREIIANTTAAHLYSTLFEPWEYQDDGRGMNLRWDPIDDRRYALRWKNPSADPPTTMRGANRLAIEALPLFPTAPNGDELATTCFRSRKGTFFTWPIWEGELSLPVVQMLLQRSISRLGESSDDEAATVNDGTAMATQRKALGIVAVFRSQRITVGKFRNFTPAKAV